LSLSNPKVNVFASWLLGIYENHVHLIVYSDGVVAHHIVTVQTVSSPEDDDDDANSLRIRKSHPLSLYLFPCVVN
jgi:hypothetical protein